MEIIKPRAKIHRVEKQYFPDTKARQRHDLKKGNYRLISLMHIYICKSHQYIANKLNQQHIKEIIHHNQV